MRIAVLAILAATVWLTVGGRPVSAASPDLTPHDLIVRDFRFNSGEVLPELRLRYYTVGQPRRDAVGRIDNAVLLLHGTGGSARSFLVPQFADVLLNSGGLLDPATHFIIIPDSIGHGGSSKPSNGLRMRFPRYDYADMVEAQHRVVAALGVSRLRLVLGTSMGCMHAFMWGEAWPDEVAAMMPLACLPVEIAGRNRIARKLAIEAIRADPAWRGGDYTEQPLQGLRTAASLSMLTGAAVIPMQAELPTRAAADVWVEREIRRRLEGVDANDQIYAIDASRTYDPSKDLEKITAAVTWVNSADDFSNPPELRIAEREAARLRNGRFVLIPAGPDSWGHGTHSWSELWKRDLAELIRRSGP